MRNLSSSDFLELWERGCRLHPLDQALLLLGEGMPETSYESLADWPLGRRNQALAKMRCAGFGPRLQGWTSCMECGEKLEFEMDGGMFANGALAKTNSDEVISVKGHSYRLPTTRDLSRAAVETDLRRAALRIIESCRLDSGQSPELSDEDMDELGQRMAAADPMAEVLIDLRCPVCGKQSSEVLDIVSFFWAEIEARAKRLLGDIHALASVYGWTEREILSLGDRRRALYLEMVRG